MTDNELIAEVRAALEAATPGPWERLDPDGAPYGRVGYRIRCGALEMAAVDVERRTDAALIAAAPAWLAELCDRVERLHFELERSDREVLALTRINQKLRDLLVKMGVELIERGAWDLAPSVSMEEAPVGQAEEAGEVDEQEDRRDDDDAAPEERRHRDAEQEPDDQARDRDDEKELDHGAKPTPARCPCGEDCEVVDYVCGVRSCGNVTPGWKR